MADTVSGMAFMHLAHEVADAVNERNLTQPPTVKVDVSGKNAHKN